MIDQIQTTFSTKKYKLVDPRYKPSLAVTRSRLSGPQDATQLSVLLPPWHGGGEAFERLARRLEKRGSAVLSYDFSNYILDPDVNQVIESYQTIAERVTKELKELIKDRGFKQIHAIGGSLGNVALGVIASEFNGFSSATIVAAGSNLALSMWDGSRTQELRKLMEAQHPPVTAAFLDKAWRKLAPMANAPAFATKPVRIVISSTDKIIPTKYQVEMKETLVKAGAIVTPQTTRLGHYMAIANYCYFGKLPV